MSTELSFFQSTGSPIAQGIRTFLAEKGLALTPALLDSGKAETLVKSGLGGLARVHVAGHVRTA